MVYNFWLSSLFNVLGPPASTLFMREEGGLAARQVALFPGGPPYSLFKCKALRAALAIIA